MAGAGADMSGLGSSAMGAQKAAGDFAYHTFGRNPKMTAILVAALVLIIIVLVFTLISMKKKDKFIGNLANGGNNPIWQLGSGDAGAYGPMHRSYTPGDSRVYADDEHHTPTPMPVLHRSCSSPLDSGAAAEASILASVQAFDPSSAKDMSDEALMSVMSGGD